MTVFSLLGLAKLKNRYGYQQRSARDPGVPLCKATVELKPDQSGLKCVQCHRVYPIRDDIPVMLVDEAKIEE